MSLYSLPAFIWCITHVYWLNISHQKCLECVYGQRLWSGGHLGFNPGFEAFPKIFHEYSMDGIFYNVQKVLYTKHLTKLVSLLWIGTYFRDTFQWIFVNLPEICKLASWKLIKLPCIVHIAIVLITSFHMMYYTCILAKYFTSKVLGMCIWSTSLERRPSWI